MFGWFVLAVVAILIARYGFLPAMDCLLQLLYPSHEDVLNDEQEAVQDQIKQIDDALIVRLNRTRARLGMHKL